jgi:tetratricopeptide (TPR) repeat protein
MLLLAAAGLLVAGAVFNGGGSSDDTIVWIGGGAVVIAAALVAAAPRRPALSPSALVFLAFFAAFVLWNGISILWSIAPDRSWSYFNRGLTYLAFAVVGGFLASRGRRAVALLLAGVFGAAVLWALAGKVEPSLFDDGGRIARLRSPVEYWNALALLIAFALPLMLWIASDRRHARTLRAAGVTLLYAALVALPLTYSRAGIAVTVIAAAAWVALSRARLESLAALALATPTAAIVAGWAFSRPALVENAQPLTDRVHDGRWFGVLLVAVGALVWLAAFAALRIEARRPLSAERRTAALRWAGGAAAVLAAVAVVVFVARGDPQAWAREFKNPPSEQVPHDPSRLGTVSSSHRWTWWKEAWQAFEQEPLIGKGAASFELTHRLLRRDSLIVNEPHNVPLQLLSETGLVGAGFLAAAAIAALLGIAGTMRRVTTQDRDPAVALALIPAVYLLHSIVDYDWDFVAISAPVFLALGALLGTAPARSWARRPFLAAAAALVALATLASLAAPWQGERNVDAAYAAISNGDFEVAVEEADEARSLNPLALEPLFAGAAAETVRGNLRRARRLHVDAVELQPLNGDAWYALGAFELRALRNPCEAYDSLNRAYTLDRFGPAGEQGGLLDQARAVRNSGRCG